MTEQIHVALLNEGTDVWRPVQAEKVADNVYLIPASIDPNAMGEKWEFAPGSRVFCQHRKVADGIILAAVRLARAAG